LHLTPTPTYANNTNSGQATASYSYGGDANHTGSSDSKNFTIDKATLTVTPANQAITLGQPDPAFTFSLSPLKGTDTMVVLTDYAGESLPTCGTASSGPHGVGTYSISCSGGVDDNYKFDTTATAALTVSYKVCLLYDDTKSFKAGSTAPLKVYLCTVTGADVSSSSIVVNANSLYRQDASPAGVLEDSGNANPDGNFRYDSGLGPSGGYIFNLSTKSPSPALGRGTTPLASGTWILSLTINGGTYTIHFDVK
jgi:hypothetical protein